MTFDATIAKLDRLVQEAEKALESQILTYPDLERLHDSLKELLEVYSLKCDEAVELETSAIEARERLARLLKAVHGDPE